MYPSSSIAIAELSCASPVCLSIRIVGRGTIPVVWSIVKAYDHHHLQQIVFLALLIGALRRPAVHKERLVHLFAS